MQGWVYSCLLYTSALAGFVKKTLPGVVCASVETPELLNAALTAWKEEL